MVILSGSFADMGGAINLKKIFWVLMSWRWQQGNALLLPQSLHNHKL
jgi:hypothetical protein